jgi:hypothetical protein
MTGVDGGLSQGFEEVGLARPTRDRDRLQHLRRLLPCEVRVTSAVHPLFGRLLSATGFKRQNGTLFLIVGLPDGSPGTIPVTATDVLGDESPSGVATVLTVEGIRELRMLVVTLKPVRRSSSRPQKRK